VAMLSDEQPRDAFAVLMSKNKLQNKTSARATSARSDTRWFRWLLVYDFEATCCNSKQLQPQELIEFSCVAVCTSTGAVVAEFQQYCRPTENPVLVCWASRAVDAMLAMARATEGPPALRCSAGSCTPVREASDVPKPLNGVT
jgi:Exonuclease